MPLPADGGHPKIFPELPVGFGVRLFGEALALFEHQHRVTFFRQPHRGDTAPESRTDDHVIVDLFHVCALRGELG